MKMIVAVTILAALVASPALAAKKKHNRNARSLESYAQAQPRQTHSHSTNPSFDVHRNGRYLGSDPDPLIRFQLQREKNSLSD